MTELTNIQQNSIKSILESLLLTTEKPISFSQLVEILPEFQKEDIKNALHTIQEKLSHPESGFELLEVAGGYQFRTKPQNVLWVSKLNKVRPLRLSRASIETLAIVAYRQPITRPEIDDIRGVDSGQVLKNLLEHNLIKILGKREEPGQPLIYGTTKEFLSFFGLKNLAALPSLQEYTELGADSLEKLNKLFPSNSMTQEQDIAFEEDETDKENFTS